MTYLRVRSFHTVCVKTSALLSLARRLSLSLSLFVILFCDASHVLQLARHSRDGRKIHRNGSQIEFYNSSKWQPAEKGAKGNGINVNDESDTVCRLHHAIIFRVKFQSFSFGLKYGSEQTTEYSCRLSCQSHDMLRTFTFN